MEKGGSHVRIIVISKPIKPETSASTQMTDNLPKLDTTEFTSHFTANFGFIQAVFGRPEFNAASVIAAARSRVTKYMSTVPCPAAPFNAVLCNGMPWIDVFFRYGVSMGSSDKSQTSGLKRAVETHVLKAIG